MAIRILSSENISGEVLIASGKYLSWGTAGATSIEGSTVSNKLQFRTNSTNAVIIDSSQNVGIGNFTNPNDGNLVVKKDGLNTGIPNSLTNASFSEGGGQLKGLTIGYRTDETTAVIAARTATGDIAFMGYDGGWLETARFTNDNKLGIGTDNPDAKVHIFKGSNGSTTVGTASDELILENNTDCGLTIRSGADSTGVVSFASPTDHNVGQLYYNHDDDSMVIRTNDAIRTIIGSSGIMYIMGATASTNNSLQLQYNSTAGTAEIYSKSTGGSTSFEFYTSSSGTTTQKFNIGSSGDVRITTNGKFLQGIRNTGSAAIDMIGFVSGTDTLQIKGGTSGAANAISFYDTGGFLGTWYNSNFGIGTTSPSSKLTIDNGSASGGSLLKSSNSDYTAHFIANTGTGAAGIYMDAMDGDFIGSNYGFIGQNNAGYMEYTVSPSSPLPYHYFAQNVGIGTTSPQQLLHISNTSGDFGAEAVLRGSTSTGTPKSEIAFKRFTSGDGAEMVLRTSNSSGTIQDVMTLSTSGNVAISGYGIQIDRPDVAGGKPYIFWKSGGTTQASIYGASSGTGLRIFLSGGTAAFDNSISFTGIVQQNAQSVVLSNSAYANAAAVQAYATNTANVYPGYGFHKASQLGGFLYATSRTELRYRGDGGTDKVLLMADSDYEQGTWTPVAYASSGTATGSYSQQLGTYTKIGRQVTCMFDFQVTLSGTMVGFAGISGLPFTVGNSSAGGGSMAGYSVNQFRSSDLFSAAGAGRQISGFPQQNANYIYCQVDNSGVNGFGSAAAATWKIGTSGRCTGYVVYFTD